MKKEAEAYYFGNSMKGVFRPGDVLELSECAWEDLHCGDIVAVQIPELLYVHRVIQKSDDKIITQGDNNPAPDRHILIPSDVFQKVTARRDRTGKRFPVTSGAEGMVEFRRNQRFQWIVLRRSQIGKICFWRQTLMPEILPGGVCEWRWHKHLIATRTRSTPLRYRRSWYRIFFLAKPIKKDLP